jgi:hypothetical protein
MSKARNLSKLVVDATGDVDAESLGNVTVTPTAVSDKPNASTGYFSVPAGSTAQRPVTPTNGMVRYNATIGKNEVYDSDGWIAIATPPLINSVSPITFNGEQGTTFTITGSAFDSGAVVRFITKTGVEFTAATSTRISSSQITATTPRDFTVAEEPLSVRVINGTGLASTLNDTIDCGGTPTWNTAAGSIATIFDSVRSSFAGVSVNASDPDSGATISYSIISGSLPSGLSFNTATGAITGTPNAVGSDTTSSFTVRATDNAGNTNDRTFSITVRAAVVVTYTFTGGDQTFVVPSGVSQITAKIWGAGGSSYHGAGGAGGYTQASVSTTPGENLIVVVGGAGGYLTSSYGGGGYSNPDGSAGGPGGGGRSSLYAGGVDFLTAGAGGGGGYGGNVGGGGGGLNGRSGGGPGAGSGAAQVGGGAGGCGSGGCASSGNQYSGGTSTGGYSGGGGGGGWYGGGGASGVSGSHAGGGGGSGFAGRNGSSALSGDELGSTTTFADTTPRTDTVNGRTYRNTRCLRGATGGGSPPYTDGNWISNAGARDNNGLVVITY